MDLEAEEEENQHDSLPVKEWRKEMGMQICRKACRIGMHMGMSRCEHI